jgi:hypothetical protein
MSWIVVSSRADEVLDELAILTRRARECLGPAGVAGHFVGLAAGRIARGKPMSATIVRLPTCSRPAMQPTASCGSRADDYAGFEYAGFQ